METHVDTLIFVSSVTLACCKLIFCRGSVKMSPVLTFSEYFTYQLPYKE